MLAFLKAFDPIEWLLIAAIAALSVVFAVQWAHLGTTKVELAHAQTALSDLKTQYAQAAEKASEAARTEEARRTQAAQKVIEDAHTQVQEAETAARDAGDARDRLQQRVAALIAASRTAGAHPATGAGIAGQQGSDPLDLLASVLTRMGDDGGQVAAYADRLRIAGQSCEAQYDSLSTR